MPRKLRRPVSHPGFTCHAVSIDFGSGRTHHLVGPLKLWEYREPPSLLEALYSQRLKFLRDGLNDRVGISKRGWRSSAQRGDPDAGRAGAACSAGHGSGSGRDSGFGPNVS